MTYLIFSAICLAGFCALAYYERRQENKRERRLQELAKKYEAKT